MAKKSSVKARKKAVKKLDKAVKKAVKKGVSEEEVEQTVNGAIAKQPPAKRSAPRTFGRTRKALGSTPTVRDEDLE